MESAEVGNFCKGKLKFWEIWCVMHFHCHAYDHERVYDVANICKKADV